MATKTRMVTGKMRQRRRLQAAGAERALEFRHAMGSWKEFTGFLTDVRGEMRKVVTPSRKEVEATTTVVIMAVFIFGVYFFVVDFIFSIGLTDC